MKQEYEKKFIYKITNKINNKVYIGQTIHPQRRWVEHKNKAKMLDDQYPIHLAMNKYGIDNFTFEVLEEAENYNEREKELIKEYNSISPNGYNIQEGGQINNIMYGEDNPRNSISNTNVLNIINDLKENKLSDREIAKKYNTSDKIVSDINHGRTHKQNNQNYPIRIKKGRQKLTLEQSKEIKQLLEENNLTYDQIAFKYNVSKGAIYHINKGLTFKEEDRIYPIRNGFRKGKI